MLTVFLRKICILGIAEYFLNVLFQISVIKKIKLDLKNTFFARYVFDLGGGGGGGGVCFQ